MLYYILDDQHKFDHIMEEGFYMGIVMCLIAFGLLVVVPKMWLFLRILELNCKYEISFPYKIRELQHTSVSDEIMQL